MSNEPAKQYLPTFRSGGIMIMEPARHLTFMACQAKSSVAMTVQETVSHCIGPRIINNILCSRRMTLKRSVPVTSDIPHVPNTPKRQRIPPSLACPDAPRKACKLTPSDVPRWSSPSEEAEIQNAVPFWTKGRPLESFEFGDPDFKPQDFSMPVFPTCIRNLPRLGSVMNPSSKSWLDPSSPLPKGSFALRCGLDQSDGSELTNSRKRLRVQTQRQLKFAPGSPLPASMEFPKLAEFSSSALSSQPSLAK